MRWLRLLSALAFAEFRTKLDMHETSFKKFRVWLTDIDASIMNHAAMLTVFECGRIDFMVRTGFLGIARSAFKVLWKLKSTSTKAKRNCTLHCKG